MTAQLVVFILDDQRYALPLSAVERIVRVVEVNPLPKAPDIVMGVINVQGRIVPVVDLRRCFRLPEKEISLVDQLIIVNTYRRTYALVADEVRSVVEIPEHEIVGAQTVLPGLEYVEGVAKLKDGMVFSIHHLDSFLSIEEEKGLDDVLRETK